MSGTVSSLGLASGTLNSSLISQLRAAEESARITPIDKKLTTNKQKQSDLSTLMTGLATLKTSAADLADDTLYLSRNATSTSTDVGISVRSGVSVQSFTVGVSQLAQNDVYQTAGFASSESTVATSASTMSIKIGNDQAISLTVASGTTLSSLAEQISDATDGKVTASVLNTGDSSNPYKLIIKSKDSGISNRLTITESLGLGLSTPTYTATSTVATGSSTTTASGDITINGIAINGITTSSSASAESNAKLFMDAINAQSSKTKVYATTDGSGKLSLSSLDGSAIVMNNLSASAATATGLAASAITSDTTVLAADSTYSAKKIQSAQDAIFTYNGVTMKRSSNTVTDLAVGMTLTLNNTTTSNATIKITQNTDDIKSGLQSFIESYNSVALKIGDLTTYDTDTKTAATFTGQSEITSILSSLNSVLNKQDAQGRSLADLGVERSENGTISLNTSTLTTMLQNNASEVEEILKGSTTYTPSVYKTTSSVTSTTQTLASGDLQINGIDIGSLELSGGTAQANAELLIAAINTKTTQTGVTASTDGNGHLILKDPKGNDISLTTTSNGALLTGLTSSAKEDYIAARGSSTKVNGFFADLNNVLGSLISGNSSTLELFKASLVSDAKTETDNRAKIVAQLNTRYETMATKFASYDSLINKYNQMGSTLTTMIDALTKTSNS